MAITNRNRLLEKYVQVVREDGLNTNKNVNIGVAGATSSATLSVGSGGINTTGPIAGLDPIVTVTGNVTLTAAQSNSTVVLNVASGATVTLPSDAAGITYNFAVGTTVTSNSYKVIIGSTSSYFTGGINVPVAAGTAKVFYGDGSSLLSINLNGSTTGGLQGGYFTVTCLKAGLWVAQGSVEGSGTVATPFASS